MSRQIGVALVGCGYWGMNYARIFSELPGSRLVAACDHRAERRAEVQRRFPAAALTDEVDALLTIPAVEAVVVATDATDHYETARRCALAGKHLLIEKPLTTSGAQADALVALAESRRLTLMVGHTFLYNSGIRRARDYIDRADLGRIYYWVSCHGQCHWPSPPAPLPHAGAGRPQRDAVAGERALRLKPPLSRSAGEGDGG